MRPSREASPGIRLIAPVALGYWAVFWTFNGLDKFLNRTEIGPLRWYGKLREEQFNAYFSNMDIPQGLTMPVLVFAGVWEITVGMLFLGALCCAATRLCGAATALFLPAGFAYAGVTLIAFSAFDIVSGDRGELIEHGLYMTLLLVSWTAVCVSRRAVFA